LSELSGRLTYFDQPACPATIEIIPYDRQQRLVRAVLALLACWGLAAVTSDPVLHLVLVHRVLPGRPVLRVPPPARRGDRDAD
jgi:hypothetical protein